MPQPVVDLANIASSAGGAVQPILFNVTCAGAVNLLPVCIMTDESTAAGVPTSVTYNVTNALTLLGSHTFTSNYRGTVSWWEFPSPPLGTFQLSITNPNNPTGYGAIALPTSGVDLTHARSCAAGAHASSTAAAGAGTNAGANDIALAGCFIRGNALTGQGAPQSELLTPFACGIDFGGIAEILGAATPPNFAWTLGASNNWIVLPLTIFGVVAAAGGGLSGSGLSRGAGLSGAGLSGAGLSRTTNL